MEVFIASPWFPVVAGIVFAWWGREPDGLETFVSIIGYFMLSAICWSLALVFALPLVGNCGSLALVFALPLVGKAAIFFFACALTTLVLELADW
jgi:hypothetical protein